MSDLIYGVFGGDMGALNTLFVLLIPVFVVGAGISALVNKMKGK